MSIAAYRTDTITHRKDIFYCYRNISKCLEDQGKTEDAIMELTRVLYDPTLAIIKGNILELIAEIYHRDGDFERFMIYAEGSLKENPNNSGLRFKLAFKYSEFGHNRIGILHYKVIAETQKESFALNNCAIDYAELGLKGKSVESLIQSADLNNTLAMANLADRYLIEGFITDAEREIERANQLVQKGVQIHGNVGLARNKLNEIIAYENKKERTILIDAEKERQFRVKYAEAYYADIHIGADNIVGDWNTKWGKIKIQKGKEINTIEVNEIVTEEKEEKRYDSALLEALSNLSKNRTISITGIMSGCNAPHLASDF